MAVISVRLDDSTKKQLDGFCHDMGISTSTIFKVFASKVAKEQRLPFSFEIDSFYSEANMAELRQRVRDMDAGINCHEHELIEV